MTDDKLIRQYVADGSQDAFKQIVERYLKPVYATCLREVRNPELAQDVAQTVFVLLAQKARHLRRGTVLSGWLFTTARFAGKEALRQENRRRRYETQAVQEMPRYEDQMEQAEATIIIEPWLNEALSGLKPGDREALLLRYSEERSMREIGEQYGISEHSAHMRVNRALEKLRRGLKKRGVESPDTSVLSVVLISLLTGSLLTLPSSVSAAAIVHTVPGVLTGIAGTTVAGARLIQLTQGVNHAMRILQIKTAAVVLAGCLTVGVGTAKLAHSGAVRVAGVGIPSATVRAAKTANTVLYTVTDLGIPPGFDGIGANAINNKGEIVGGVNLGNKSQPFYYHDGLLRIIKTPGLSGCIVTAINDKGTIVGYMDGDGLPHMAIIGTKDKLSQYSPPAALATAEFLRFDGINNNGVIMGRYGTDKSGRNSIGFLLSGGQLQQTEQPGLSYRGINDNGEAIGNTRPGNTGFLYSRGVVTLLPSQPGYLTDARAMNNHGDVTGWMHRRGTPENRAFLYHNGKLTDLGTVPGFETSHGWAINNAGVVAGTVERDPFPDTPVWHAAIFKDGQATDLNTLIDSANGWELEWVRGINDRGQIVGNGTLNGKQRAFLLTPKS